MDCGLSDYSRQAIWPGYCSIRIIIRENLEQIVYRSRKDCDSFSFLLFTFSCLSTRNNFVRLNGGIVKSSTEVSYARFMCPELGVCMQMPP
jgi:hypothetical protein